MGRNEVEEKIAATEARRREAEEELEEKAARLAELEDERGVLLGEAALAERRAGALHDHLAQLQEELVAVERAEAYAAVDAAVRARDAALARGAEAAHQLSAAIEQIEKARMNLAEAHREVRAKDAGTRMTLPPEPNTFDEHWQALAPLVEAELGIQLESKLVEAAARSSNYLVINHLPEHLRELARQRKRELLRGTQARHGRPPGDPP